MCYLHEFIFSTLLLILIRVEFLAQLLVCVSNVLVCSGLVYYLPNQLKHAPEA